MLPRGAARRETWLGELQAFESEGVNTRELLNTNKKTQAHDSGWRLDRRGPHLAVWQRWAFWKMTVTFSSGRGNHV